MYAIETFKRLSWYLICEDYFDGIFVNYPIYVYSGCFDIIDGRLSRLWQVYDQLDRYNFNEKKIILCFKEFLSENFYPNLLDNYEKEVETFKVIKTIMDLEFA